MLAVIVPAALIPAALIPAALILGIVAMFAAFIHWARREEDGGDPRWGIRGQIATYSPGIRPPGSSVYVGPMNEGMLLRSNARQEADWEQPHPWYCVHAEIADNGVRLGGPFGVVLAYPTDATPLATVLDRLGPRCPRRPFTT